MGIACLFVSESGPMIQGASLITQANARMRHPLTPSSHAGFARRTIRSVRGAVAATIDLGSFGGNGVGVSSPAPTAASAVFATSTGNWSARDLVRCDPASGFPGRLPVSRAAPICYALSTAERASPRSLVGKSAANSGDTRAFACKSDLPARC
jgi:hypothetical protein